MDRSLAKRASRIGVALLCAGAIVLSASARTCLDDEEPFSQQESEEVGAEESGTTAANAGDTDSFLLVTFTTDDGLTLHGRQYGSGTKAVILSHMYPADQTGWDTVAQDLSRRGYMVLTYDFRGYGQSEGSKDDLGKIDKDLDAAFKQVATVGAEEVVFVGASMGGTASLVAASEFQVLSSIRTAGVVTLSAPVEFMGLSAAAAVSGLEVPLLLIAAEDDEGAEAARQLQELSGGKGQLEIVAGDAHGTNLFRSAQADQVWSLLLTFLDENMPVAEH